MICARYVLQTDGVSGLFSRSFYSWVQTHFQSTLQSYIHSKKCREYANHVCAVSKVEKSSVDEDIQRAFCRQRDHLEKTVNSLKMRLAKSTEEHEKVYIQIMKVNGDADCKFGEFCHPSQFLVSFSASCIILQHGIHWTLLYKRNRDNAVPQFLAAAAYRVRHH